MAATCPIPEGMELPPDVEPGGTFEAIATVKLNDDGTLSISELDGNPLPDYEEKKEAADDAGFVESVTSQMR